MIANVAAFVAIAAGTGGVIVGVVGGILVNLLSDEVKGWMEIAPVALLKVAARRLPDDLRDELYSDWYADLIAELRSTGTRPISKFMTGVYFSAGLIAGAPHVVREARRTQARSQEPMLLQLVIAQGGPTVVSYKTVSASKSTEIVEIRCGRRIGGDV